MCSNTVCLETTTDLLILAACCDDQLENVCGVFVGQTLGPLKGCLAKHRPGTPSESCGELLDQLDKPLDTLDPGHDGAFTFKLGDEVVALPACCVSTGECGVRYDKFDVLGRKVAVGAGCVPVSRLDLADYGDSVPITASRSCVP